jgi:uncharacterized protein YbjT (DUF2867 family)
MSSILLFGGTGHLGQKIASELKFRQYKTTAVVRSKDKGEALKDLVDEYIIADVTKATSLKDICNGYPIIISSLGKSVSLNDRNKYRFRDIDYGANMIILYEAIKSDVKKFVYVSALGAERYTDLEYFKTHQQFSEALKKSGIDYSIIKPPALFSAFLDLIPMARKGQLATLGKGDKKTNPIYEGDLARVVADSINLTNVEIEAGGKNIYTRKQINQIIQNAVNPNKKVATVPFTLVNIMLPVIKLLDRNLYDKLAFYAAVVQHDAIAPAIGEMSLEEYIQMKTS